MLFDEKLKKAMQELGINQKKVCDLTGKSKGSVSMYLNGKTVPPENVQSDIAVALGLAPDYFVNKEENVVVFPHKYVANGIIPRLKVEVAAKALGINHSNVKKGLKQGVFPWGYAIQTSENRWIYIINATRFQEIEGVELTADQLEHSLLRPRQRKSLQTGER